MEIEYIGADKTRERTSYDLMFIVNGKDVDVKAIKDFDEFEGLNTEYEISDDNDLTDEEIEELENYLDDEFKFEGEE